MKHPERILGLAAAALLAACGSDQTAAGGTGSDFPIHPAVAVVVSPSGERVPAAAWRLWKVDPDSIRYASELQPTSDSGFELPDHGSWLVEAWSTASAAGKGAGFAAAVPHDPDFERCLNWIGRNRSSADPAPAVLSSCRELSSPSVQARGSSQSAPAAIAAFRLPAQEDRSSTVTGSDGQPLPTRRWRLWRATGDVLTGDLPVFASAGFQTSGESGALELEGLQGTWIAEGWNAAPAESLFRAPPARTGIEGALLDLCLGSDAEVLPRRCDQPLFEDGVYGFAPDTLRRPDVVVVFRLPSR